MEITITLDLQITLDHQVISVAIIVIVTVIPVVTILVTNVIRQITTTMATIMEVSTAILVLVDPIVASILVANASIPIVSVQTSTAILVHAVMTQIVETDAIVTVMETTIGGMEFEPEMKVDKKDLLSLTKDQLQTMLEIKDFPVPLIKDQVLMLLFLLKNGEIKTNKKCQIEMEINTFL